MATLPYILSIPCFLLLLAPAAAQLDLPPDHPKYKTSQKIFDDLVRAIGVGRTKPRLRLLGGGADGALQVAWYAPQQNAIVLEERFYDLCTSLGPDSLNGLGFILGHELAHYYNNHYWEKDFASSFANLSVGTTLKGLNLDPATLVKNEAEADLFGGFYGHIAGYNTLGLAPTLLERIYAEYGLDAQLEGYPPLAERQQVAAKALEKLHRKVPIFEAGHRLLLLGQYEEAGRCFDLIGRTFASREILNNAGLARALEALNLFGDGVLPFAYPFELDAHTRLKGGDKASQYDPVLDSERRQRLLDDAADYFAEARRKDPTYATAYINEACIADLKNQYDDAEHLANKAIKIARDQPLSLANALILRGITRIRGQLTDEKTARADFERAQAGNPALAQLNLALLAHTAPLPIHSEKRPAAPEAIADYQALDYDGFLKDPDMPNANVPSRSHRQPAINIYTRHTPTWSGWLIETSYRAVSLLETNPGYSGEIGPGHPPGGRTDPSPRRLRHPQPHCRRPPGDLPYLPAGRHRLLHQCRRQGARLDAV